MDGTRDAITDLPIDPRRHVRFESPDGKLVLHYNTSTLIQWARTKGKFLDPPHFRSDINPELRKAIEQIEGRTLEQLLRGHRPDPEQFDDPALAPTADDQFFEGTDPFAEVRHAEAVQLAIDNHYEYLEKKELYMCRKCFEFIVEDHELPPPQCPFDVIDSVNDLDKLPHFIFRTAAKMKKHYKDHHGYTDDVSSDKVRDYVAHFLSQLNHEAANRNHYYGIYNTTQSYWRRDGRFNTMRYNQLFQHIEKHTNEGGDTSQLVFDVPPDYAYEEDDGEDDWLVSDDHESTDEESPPKKSKRKEKGKKENANSGKRTRGSTKQQQQNSPRVAPQAAAATGCPVCHNHDHNTFEECPNISLDPRTLRPLYCGDEEANRRRAYLTNRLAADTYHPGTKASRLFRNPPATATANGEGVKDEDDDPDVQLLTEVKREPGRSASMRRGSSSHRRDSLRGEDVVGIVRQFGRSFGDQFMDDEIQLSRIERAEARERQMETGATRHRRNRTITEFLRNTPTKADGMDLVSESSFSSSRSSGSTSDSTSSDDDNDNARASSTSSSSSDEVISARVSQEFDEFVDYGDEDWARHAPSLTQGGAAGKSPAAKAQEAKVVVPSTPAVLVDEEE